MFKTRDVNRARGGVAEATSHKQRTRADAGLDEKNRFPAPAGFTLLEVMIALSIIAVALVALLGLAQRSISANDLAQQITRATLLAQGKMAEIEVGIETGRDGTGAAFPEPDGEYRWRSSYTPTPVTGVDQVELVVAWGAEEKNEAVRLISFVFREGGR